jgi:hypothetical protein
VLTGLQSSKGTESEWPAFVETYAVMKPTGVQDPIDCLQHQGSWDHVGRGCPFERIVCGNKDTGPRSLREQLSFRGYPCHSDT